MPKIKFYDVKGKKRFTTDEYRFEVKKTRGGLRYFAVADAPSGVESWRIVSKGFWEKFK